MTDAGRFEAFVRTYQDMVYRTALRLVGRPADAEDIAQTVFLRAFERFAEIGDSPAVAGWLKTVATNLSLNHLSRYRARWRFFSELDQTGDARDDFANTIPAPDPSPGAQDAADRQASLEQAIGALPDHQRVPLVLHHFQDRSYQDIADLLHVSLAKVKTDIHRGRAALKRVLVTDNAAAR
jgi:RNA polymerase sigma-70 factor (ECF subfamily)